MTLFATSILFLLIVSSTIVAQLPTATILGVVKDATGAVVPDAALTARNVETGQSRTTVTGGDGSYRFSALPVGAYEVRVEHPGFRSEVRQGLTLTVGQEAGVNFALEVGGVEQTISVTAEAPLVNTTSGSLGGLVDEQKVADLPLNGRNYVDLALLQTGVTPNQYKGGTNSMVGSWFSSSGAPVRSNTFLLDGASMATFMSGTSSGVAGATLGVEGIREFKVITNSFSAEYGMTMGSQMTIVSKSGTNSFHGSLFEYLRNSTLDARNFFDYKTATTPRRLPAFTRNNFGASLGGPIVRDRTFFHGVYEGVRERLGRTMLLNAIPASAKVDGGLVPQIAPVIKPLLTLFADPNLPNNQFTYPFSQPTNENYGQMRVDHTFSSNDTMFGRYTITDTAWTKPLNYPQVKSLGLSRQQFITLSENHIFSPTMLNTVRVSYSRTVNRFEGRSGISGPEFSFVPGLEIGGISIGGLTGFSSGNNNGNKQNIFTWSDDLFYTRGRHSLKFGSLINRYQQFVWFQPVYGGVSFANLTQFLLARPTSYNAATPGSFRMRTFHGSTLGFYVQDDLRVTPQLTLNLGLRYEFRTDIKEVRGGHAVLRDLQRDAEGVVVGVPFQNSSLRNFSPRFGFAWDVRGNGQTAVRGGFALLYDLYNYGSALHESIDKDPPISSESQVLNPPTFTIPFVFPPESVGRTWDTIDYNLQQPHILQYNLTVERQLPFAMALTLAYGGSRGINLMQMKEGNARIPQILPDGRHFRPADAPRINPNWENIRYMTAAANSWYNSLQFGLTKRLSHGLQFQSSYTWSKTLDETQGQLGGDFATAGTGGMGADPLRREMEKGPAGFDLAQNWRFNAIYRLPGFTSSGGVAGKLLTGWWLGGILSLQGGFPFSVNLNTNRSGTGIEGAAGGFDRPDLVPGIKAQDITQGTSRGCGNIPAGTPVGTVERWYDPCAFAIPQAGFLGTAGRNILRTPGLVTLDLSLGKDAALGFLGESGKLEFRAEFFNLLNRTNLANPQRNAFTALRDVENPVATAGRITSTATTARQIQLALKILF